MNFNIIIISIIFFHTSLLANIYSDKIISMYKFSFYADALGAPTEGGYNEDIVEGLLSASSFNSDSSHPWGMWLPVKSFNKDQTGFVTDDSYFKAFVLQRYHKWIRTQNKNLSDFHFAKFLIAESTFIKNEIFPYSIKDDHFQKNYSQHIADLIGMMNELLCEEGDDYCFADKSWEPTIEPQTSFYKKDQPICFGLFLFLPLVSDDLSSTDLEVFNKFYQLTDLDKSHASLVSGVAAVMLKNSLLKTYIDQNITQWMVKQFTLGIEKVKESSLTNKNDIKKLQYILHRSRVTAEKLKKVEFEKARKAFYDIRKNELPCYIKGLKFDPLEFMYVILTALIYGEGNIEKSLSLIINSGGDTDTIAAFLGLYIGAYYGNNLYNLNKRLLSDINDVAHNFEHLFSFDFNNFYIPNQNSPLLSF